MYFLRYTTVVELLTYVKYAPRSAPCMQTQANKKDCLSGSLFVYSQKRITYSFCCT